MRRDDIITIKVEAGVAYKFRHELLEYSGEGYSWQINDNDRKLISAIDTALGTTGNPFVKKIVDQKTAQEWAVVHTNTKVYQVNFGQAKRAIEYSYCGPLFRYYAIKNDGKNVPQFVCLDGLEWE